MQTYFSCWLLTFSCCFWSGDPVVSEETWMNPTRAAFFLRLHSRWSPFWLGETWRSVLKFNWLENYHDFLIHQEKHNFSLQYLWCHRWKKKEKKRKKTVHSTNEDWSWKISPSLCWTFRKLVCFVFQLSFFKLRIVVSSHDKAIGNFNEQCAKTSHCFQTECPLETAEPSRN